MIDDPPRGQTQRVPGGGIVPALSRAVFCPGVHPDELTVFPEGKVAVTYDLGATVVVRTGARVVGAVVGGTVVGGTVVGGTVVGGAVVGAAVVEVRCQLLHASNCRCSSARSFSSASVSPSSRFFMLSARKRAKFGVGGAPWKKTICPRGAAVVRGVGGGAIVRGAGVACVGAGCC